MPTSFRRRVAFSETDASGRVHFTALLKWVEDAEHELLASAGFPICADGFGWPRVKVSCDYRLPFVMGEEAVLQLRLTEIGVSSLRWDFKVLKADERVAAEGRLITVLVTEKGTQAFQQEQRLRLEELAQGDAA